jgi:hypothetical protein
MLREKHKGRKPRGESTDALAWDGPACNSDEGSVMGLERCNGPVNDTLGRKSGDRIAIPH